MFSENENTRALQEASYDILKSTVSVCERLGLKYLLCGGTLLGAIRHGGFIPWDDDIDIWMPREDYERFSAEGKPYLREGYEINWFRTCGEGETPLNHHIQVVDRNTEVWDRNTAEAHVRNAWIDIFPLDGLPKNKLVRAIHYYRFRFLYALMQISWFDRMVNLNKANRPLRERLVIKTVQLTGLGKNWNTNKILARMEKLVTKYPLEHCDTIGCLHGVYKKKEILPLRFVQDTVTVPFEDSAFTVSADYEAVLENFYGDWRTPPANHGDGEHGVEVLRRNGTGKTEEK